MVRRKLCVVALFAIGFVCAPSFAEMTTVQDMQDLPQRVNSVAQDKSVFDSNHWAYKTLENISKKYGLMVGKPEEQFNINKPLTRNEAAVLLVSLMGKIEQDRVQLTDIEKDRIEILKEELGKEITALTSRVEVVEKNVDTLQGSVSKLAKSDESNLKYGFGNNLKISGTLQARYGGLITRGADNYPPNFRIPVSELGVKGKLNTHLDFVANFQPSRYYDSTTTKTMMGDVYISSDLIPHHTMYLGQTRVPIGYEGTVSTLALDTIDRAQIARNYSDTRDIGIKAAGNWTFADYYLGAYNGSRYQSKDNNSNMDLAGWINIKPLAKTPQFGKLELGTGYVLGEGNYDYSTLGWYAGYKYKKFGAKYEAAYSDGGYGAADRKSSGWYTQTSYDLTKKLQLIGRLDRFDPNRNTDNNIITEYTLGSNYFMSNNNIKFQLNYVLVDNQAAKDSTRIVAQTQYNF